MIPTYYDGTENPPITRDWYGPDGNLIDLSSGYTFSARVGVPGVVATVVDKQAGITGSATSPNLTVNWAPGELDPVPKGRWSLHVYAHHVATGEERMLAMAIRKRAAIAHAVS